MHFATAPSLLLLLSAILLADISILLPNVQLACALTIPPSAIRRTNGIKIRECSAASITLKNPRCLVPKCDRSPSFHSASSVSLTDDEGFKKDITNKSKNSNAESKKTINTKTPSVRSVAQEVAALGLPALGGMVIDPIMSLVDSSCVGQISTTHLASMAPCTSIYQFLFCVYFFLSATTTNLVASSSHSEETSGESGTSTYAEKVLSTAIVLAIILGTLTSASLYCFSDFLLSIAGATPDLLPPARAYLQIRAISFPAVLILMVLQGSDLGRQDSITPLKIFGIAGIVNLIGDIYLTLGRGMGVKGAAIATAVSQLGAAIFYVWRASSRRSPNDVIATDSKEARSISKREKQRAERKNRRVKLRFTGLPSKALLKEFSAVGVTLLLRAIGCMCFYSLATRTAATFGSVSLAAHQLTLQVWWLLSYIPEPMSTAAQSIVARDAKRSSFDVVSKVVKVLLGVSTAAGLLAAVFTGLTLSMPSTTRMLVSDHAVRDLMLKTVPFAALAQFACAVCTIADGVCVGTGSFGHLPYILVSSTAIASLGLLGVAKKGLGVEGVWMCFVGFFVLRIGAHTIFSKKLRQLAMGQKESAVE
uniref:Protein DETOXIFICATION n=1 Tax=Ditylum brightwellii TaxID=49249 RepID=A0A7S4WCB7_9STRA